MASEIVCDICVSAFDETQKVPLLLGCGHTFCKECVSGLHKKQPALTCPKCTVEEKRSPEALPKNFILFDRLEPQTAAEQPSSVNPWACRFHANESVAFVCQRSGDLYCPECLSQLTSSDRNIAPISTVYRRLELFYDLYKSCSTHELARRTQLYSQLSGALEAHRLKVCSMLDSECFRTVQAFQKRAKQYSDEVMDVFAMEEQRLADASQIFTLLAQMKRQDIAIEQASQQLAVPVQLEAVRSLASAGQLGRSVKLRGLRSASLDLRMNINLPEDSVEVPVSILETARVLLEGARGPSVCDEMKLSRFKKVGARWGLFDDKFQVDAVTFTTSKALFLTGIGVGNAYTNNQGVLVTRLAILDGPATNSPALYEATDVVLENSGGGQRVIKIDFDMPVELQPNKDYTIWLNLLGGAGVFRGDGTQRSLSSPDKKVQFTFKPSQYTEDMVQNGENADDGPIFDLHYKYTIDRPVESVVEPAGVVDKVADVSGEQTETFSLETSHPCKFLGLTLGGPADSTSSVEVQSIQLQTGDSPDPVLVHEQINPTLTNDSDQRVSLCFNSPILLKAKELYTVHIKYTQTGNLFKRTPGDQLTYAQDKVTFTLGEDGKGSLPSKLLTSCLFDLTESDVFALCEVSSESAALLGAETRVARFGSTDVRWDLSGDNQVESFSFAFDQRVILTAVSFGNSVSSDTPVVLESLQILLGKSTTNLPVYSSKQPYRFFNHSGAKSVVKVKLDAPVEILRGRAYTIRAALRGQAGCFKGKDFRGPTQTLADGVTFTCFKSKYKGSDRRNGNNEAAGPILDLHYVLDRPYAAKDFEDLKAQLFPFFDPVRPEMDPIGEELCVRRFDNIGSSWHINADNRQVEAIAFMVTGGPIRLSGVGLGNAFDQGSKTSVRKLQIRKGKSTRGEKLYSHSTAEKLLNVGGDCQFAKVVLESNFEVVPETWYTLRVKYKPGSSIFRGTSVLATKEVSGIKFTFEKTSFDGGDVENGSHETHGPLRDFYFQRM